MPSRDIASMRKAHKVLGEFSFEPVELEKGYANRTLRVDIGSCDIETRPVDQEMKDLWIGGKGFDLWLTFQEINKDTKWDSPENPICMSSGPLGGTTSFPGSGKTLVTAISPLTHSMMDCNVGGYFGPFLKFAGFDALMVIGRSDKEVIVFIDGINNKVTIEEAPEEDLDAHVVSEQLTEMYADNEFDKRNISVVSAGSGAEHSRMGVLNFSFWDWRRGITRLKQAGRGGIGTVLRNKQVKAIVIKNRQVTPSWTIEESPMAEEFKIDKGCDTCESGVTRDDIKKIISNWSDDPDFVIEMMQDIQEKERYISESAIETISLTTGVPKARLYHIATFYKAFSLEPRGETEIQVCVGTACHVKGSVRVLEAFERELAIERGETTDDSKYTLDAVACLGACSIAPVVKIGDEITGNVQAKDVARLLKRAAKGKSQVDKAPEMPTAPTPTKRLQPADLAQVADRIKVEQDAYKGLLMVCTGTGCVAAKGFDIRDEMHQAVQAAGLGDDFLVVPTGCNGFCAAGPILLVQPDGVFYHSLKSGDIQEIVETHLKGGQVVDRLLFKDTDGQVSEKMEEIPFFTKQQLIALRNKGIIDPENIEHYIARGGYTALKDVLAGGDSAGVVQSIIDSGIRGRGGGGFPVGVKWQSGRKAAIEREEEIFVVCNADEGDPGAFMDRSIIETDPHSVIEGMLIGAFAVGGTEGFVYLRKEYPLALERLQKALTDARAAGLLGDNILGTDFKFDITIHRGAGAFVCGESTALMASMSGRPGVPRAKYVHNVEYGYRDKPTILNNVETWANIPVILEKGADWFGSIGSGDVKGNPWGGSSGTKVFSLVGDINRTGLVEVPMGITLREIIEDIGGGIPGGKPFKAVQTGGPSGGCLPASMLDMPVDFDSLTEAGSMMGSGGMIVMDEKTCMIDVSRYFIDFLIDESCGKCTPCREGLVALKEILDRICAGKGREGDITMLEELSETVAETSLCQLGGSAPNPILSTLKYFREEYEEHIKHKRCGAGVCKELITYSIKPEPCTGCTLCAKNCPVDAITGAPKEVHVIDPVICIKCGICYEVCKPLAVEVK